MKSFVIVGVQRTGSSALAESIGLHPDVACGWEWTREVPWLRKIRTADRGLSGDFSQLPLKHQRHMAESYHSMRPIIGFRRLFRASGKWIIHPSLAPALWVDRLEDHIRWLRGRTDIHVIHIVRTQSLEWIKSVYMAKSTNSYVGKKYPSGLKVTIPLREAVARVKTKNWIDWRLSSLKGTSPYLKVCYEEMLKDRDATANAALRFLGCDVFDALSREARLEKQSTGGAADYILNYPELASRLADSGLLMSASR